MGTNNTGEYILEELTKRYTVTKNDIGADARMDKGLMHFQVNSYDVEGLGHLCVFDMNGMFGLMKMQTVVLACFAKDMPLLNIDKVLAAGNVTQMAELYDTLLKKWTTEDQADFQAIKDDDRDLPDYSSGEHWYDPILLPCSYAKKGKKIGARTEKSCQAYFDTFLEKTEEAEDCDPETKREKVRGFAQGLLDHGGPAVDQVRKMFGEEKTKKLILGYMYGVE